MKKPFFYAIGIICIGALSAPSYAKTKFSKKEIVINNIKLMVEVAQSPEQLKQGLMFRKALKETAGMLFIFPNEETRSFWMKNTFIPLSIGFFDSQKILVDIQDMKPVVSEMEINVPIYTSAQPARYALEVTQDWFSKKKIKIGNKFRFR